MQDSQGPKSSISGGTLGIIAAAFVLVLVVLTWGPWNSGHVETNPGPSGTPGSTTVDQTPPPAESPSPGTTTGSSR
jgi:hypothetical protein